MTDTVTEVTEEYDMDALYELLSESYQSYTTTGLAKEIGVAYTNKYFDKLGGEAPDLKEQWTKFSSTPNATSVNDFLDDAGVFLALMDTMKRKWDTAYQDAMERAYITDETLKVPEKYVLPKHAVALRVLKAFLSLGVFGAVAAATMVTILFASANVFSLWAVLSAHATALVFVVAWTIVHLRWRKKYNKAVVEYKRKVENYKLVWKAKFGAHPLVTREGTVVLPANPYSWALHYSDRIKYKEVTDYLDDLYVNPNLEKSPPILALPAFSDEVYPVPELNTLRDKFRDDLDDVNTA